MSRRCGRFPSASALEDVFLVAALGAGVMGHVLDEAEGGDVHLPEHVEAFARVDEGDVLGRGDDDGAGQRDPLGERELHVSRPRRQVHQEEVLLAPAHAGQQLVDRLHDHRSPPDGRLIGVHERAQRGHENAVALDGQEAVVGLVDVGLLVDAHHHLLRRAVDVGVDQTDAVAQAHEGHGEVRGDGGLSDASLARGHGHLEAHVAQEAAVAHTSGSMRNP